MRIWLTLGALALSSLAACAAPDTSLVDTTAAQPKYELNERGGLKRSPEQLAERKALLEEHKNWPIPPVPFPSEKSLVDFFLPMEPQAALTSQGLWGDANVLPRDPHNGLESSGPTHCYWDGQIVRDEAGKYHMYASRWDQSYSHSNGWKLGSKAVHAVSDDAMGPYVDQGLMWPHWNDGAGHNVVGLRMKDGRYAAVTSEGTPGEIFVSDDADGPWELLGEIETDDNGFVDTVAGNGLARYPWNGRMSNVMVSIRPDGRYMITARSTAPMISEDGITGPYKVMNTRTYANIEGFPQHFMEDPTLWYSGGMYHLVVNHHPTNRSYHLTSEDGITGWVNRGIAFTKDQDIFKYTDGTVNRWRVVQRPTAFLQDGHVTHFLFSVIDTTKGGDKPNDNHCSKIVVVPFDGAAFDIHMKELVEAEVAARLSGASAGE